MLRFLAATRTAVLAGALAVLFSAPGYAAYIGSPPILVPEGGTGASSLAQYGVIVGEGTGPLQAVTGGAGQVLEGAASANPGFTATPTLGASGTTTGTLALAEAAGGTVTIAPPSSATYNWNLPTSAGASNQLLLSGGGGAAAMSFANLCSLLTAGSNVSISGTTNCTIASASGATSYSLATYTSTTTPYTIPSTNGLTLVISQTTPAPLTLNLPSTSLVSGMTDCVKDGTNNFGTHNVTVKTTDGSTIDGTAGTTGFSMIQAHGANCFQYDGTSKWYVM